MNTRNIIIIGRTGNGKSTIANIITGTNKFEEGKYAISKTENKQIEEVNISGTKYRIIDTVGIGDTKLSEEEVLNKIAEAASEVKDGLSQILFITSGKFTKEETEVYDILRKVVFDKDVFKYTTIIRTNFPDYNDEDECQMDLKLMKNENEDIERIVGLCRKVIHVDNPPINIKNKKKLDSNKEDRKYSKRLLRTYLTTCQEVYKPNNLDQINERVGEHVKEKERLQELEKRLDLSEKEKIEIKKELAKVKAMIAEETKGMCQKAGEKVDQYIIEPLKRNCRIS